MSSEPLPVSAEPPVRSAGPPMGSVEPLRGSADSPMGSADSPMGAAEPHMRSAEPSVGSTEPSSGHGVEHDTEHDEAHSAEHCENNFPQKWAKQMVVCFWTIVRHLLAAQRRAQARAGSHAHGHKRPLCFCGCVGICAPMVLLHVGGLLLGFSLEADEVGRENAPGVGSHENLARLGLVELGLTWGLAQRALVDSADLDFAVRSGSGQTSLAVASTLQHDRGRRGMTADDGGRRRSTEGGGGRRRTTAGDGGRRRATMGDGGRGSWRTTTTTTMQKTTTD